MTVAYVVIAYTAALVAGVVAFVIAALVAPGSEYAVAGYAGVIGGIAAGCLSVVIVWRKSQ